MGDEPTPQVITGNEAFIPEAERLVESMRTKSHDDRVDIAADALMAEFRKGVDARYMTTIDASEIAASLTSAGARLIGIALRDGQEEAVDACVAALTRVIDGLEEFAMLAGSDTGAEPIQDVLREIVGYMRARDYVAASEALDRRIAMRKEREAEQR